DGEFTEGPALAPDGTIYFSDIGNRIMRFDPKTRQTTVYRDPSGRSNGMKFDAQGRLIVCEGGNAGGNRRISLTAATHHVRTLGGKRILHDFGPDRRPIDGMTLDLAGNIVATAGTKERAGIYVFGPRGEALAFFPTPGDPTNCCFGGGDESSTLYVTAQAGKK